MQDKHEIKKHLGAFTLITVTLFVSVSGRASTSCLDLAKSQPQLAGQSGLQSRSFLHLVVERQNLSYMMQIQQSQIERLKVSINQAPSHAYLGFRPLEEATSLHATLRDLEIRFASTSSKHESIVAALVRLETQQAKGEPLFSRTRYSDEQRRQLKSLLMSNLSMYKKMKAEAEEVRRRMEGSLYVFEYRNSSAFHEITAYQREIRDKGAEIALLSDFISELEAIGQTLRTGPVSPKIRAGAIHQD